MATSTLDPELAAVALLGLISYRGLMAADPSDPEEVTSLLDSFDVGLESAPGLKDALAALDLPALGSFNVGLGALEPVSGFDSRVLGHMELSRQSLQMLRDDAAALGLPSWQTLGR